MIYRFVSTYEARPITKHHILCDHIANNRVCCNGLRIVSFLVSEVAMRASQETRRIRDKLMLFPQCSESRLSYHRVLVIGLFVCLARQNMSIAYVCSGSAANESLNLN